MGTRFLVGCVVAAAFVAFLAHTTAATQCPAREPGACARVHALMMRTRAAKPRLALVAPPMTSREVREPERLALSGYPR